MFEGQAGPRWVREQHDFLTLPLLARPGETARFGVRREETASTSRPTVRTPGGCGSVVPAAPCTHTAGRATTELRYED